MLIEQGVVTELAGEKARVATKRGASCKTCAGKTACSALGGGSENDAEVFALNRADAKVGDVVELSLPERAFLWATVAVYLIPVLCLLTGALLGNSYHASFGMSADGASALGALAGICVGLFFTFLASRRASRTGSTMPVIDRVLERPNPSRIANHQ